MGSSPDEIFSRLGHDLRNPLTSIRCSLGIVRAGMAGDIPEPARPLVEIAYQNCERLARMLEEILELRTIIPPTQSSVGRSK